MKPLPFAALLALLLPATPAKAQYYQAYPYPYPYPAYPYPAYPQPYPPSGYDTQPPPADNQSAPDPSQTTQDQSQGYSQDQSAPDSQAQASQPYQLQPAPGAPASGVNIGELLAAHNAYRTPLGLTPLRWSTELAAQAQQWAEHLVQIGRMEHSGPGQNLAMASSGTQSLTALVSLWGDERRYFTNGDFPNVSTTGAWKDAGHYSQLVWRSTREVGCGFASGNGQDFLVCDYDPVGNVMGQRPY